MRQGYFMTGTRDQVHISRRRAWKNSVLEKSIVKVIRDGLNACRIPNYEVKARAPCAKCHMFTVAASEPGIPDLIGWIPAGRCILKTTLSAESVKPVHWMNSKAIPLFIEVKRPQGGIESEAQKQFVERVNKDVGIALFARDWDTVADALKAAGVKIPEELCSRNNTVVNPSP
jgi:hypothetical protein